jgi:hypothetical protein
VATPETVPRGTAATQETAATTMAVRAAKAAVTTAGRRGTPARLDPDERDLAD